MRNSIHCICGDQDPPLSLLNYAKEIDAPLTLIKEGYQGEIGLEGAHQRINAAVAIKAIEKLNYLFPVTNNMIVEGIIKAQIAARFQKIIIGDKTVILDVAHNPAAVETLVNTLLESPIETVAIFSALADKNIDDMIKLSSNSIKQWFLVPLSSERSIQLDALNDKFADSQTTTVCANMDSAINETLGLKNIKRIVIFGSFYTIADASEILNLM